MRRAIGLFTLVLLVAAGEAQLTTGTISGTVKDSTGAVLPGATVEVQNVGTGIGRTVTTDSRGYYTAPNLSLGQYEVSASLSGFQTTVRRGITLNVGENAVIGFTLQVGTVTESVEVTGEAPLVETTTANVAGLVDEKQVQDLPLNARNLINLATLNAGVAFAVTGEQSRSRGFGTKITIAGTRFNASLFQVDGVDVNDVGGSVGSASGIMMGAETVREFNVITNGYSAEFGKHTGGVFNAVTKSGTNSLHGSVFEFLRNAKLDAHKWEDNAFHEGVKPAFKRNQFGASAGGPIVKDRTFFFGSYEGLRERLGRTLVFNVPTLAVRQGILPNLTQAQCTAANGTVLANGSCLIPVATAVRPWLDAYPQPNGRDHGDGVADFATSRGFPTTEDFFTVRVDHKLSDKDSLFVRYTFDDATRIADQTLVTSDASITRAQHMALGETRIFSPAVLNEFLFGYSRNTAVAEIGALVEGLSRPIQSFTNESYPGLFGDVNVEGLDPFAPHSPSGGTLNVFQVKDDLYYTRGAHSFKFGFNLQRYRDARDETLTPEGGFTFLSIEDFLQGIVGSFEASLPGSTTRVAYFRQNLIAFYGQDDYRITPRLTLNLGLRYEFLTTFVEKFDRIYNMRDFATPGRTTADVFVGGPAFLNPSKKNFAPRVGLAWDPTGSGKTSVRAGFGIFHEQLLFTKGNLAGQFAEHPLLYSEGTINVRGLARFPDAFFTQPELLGAKPKFDGMEYKPKQPTIYKYSLDLQHEVTPNTTVDLGYSGTRGVHLVQQVMMNTVTAEERDGRLFVSSNAPFTHPAFDRMRPGITNATSDYHALRLTVTRRFSQGLQFQGAYTWSKALDDSSNYGGTDFANSIAGTVSPYRSVKSRGLADFDLRRNFVGNFTYDLPGRGLEGAAGKLLGGWQISGILALRDGTTARIRYGGLPPFMTNGFIGDSPDYVAGDKGVTYDTRNPNAYFDVSAFANPPRVVPPGGDFRSPTGAFIGNAGRGLVIAPGAATLDFVLSKETSLREGVRLQFRSEFYNLFNRVNFGLPEGRIFDSRGRVRGNVATITNTLTTSRQIQFGLRLVF